MCNTCDCEEGYIEEEFEYKCNGCGTEFHEFGPCPFCGSYDFEEG